MEEMQELREDWNCVHGLENFVQVKPGLFSLTGRQARQNKSRWLLVVISPLRPDLRRVYIMDGASAAKKGEEEEKVFLS